MNQGGKEGVYDNKAFREGRQAYKDGKFMDDNPHHLYSKEYEEWARGMTEAAQEDGVNPL